MTLGERLSEVRRDCCTDWSGRWANTDYRQLDANFRLKLKQRGLCDHPLNYGCAYILRDPPYHDHLTRCGPQTEVCRVLSHVSNAYTYAAFTKVNICDSGLHAVDHANLRGGAAYIASGVGAFQCRHMMVMPAGVGDLQKGEKCVFPFYPVFPVLIGS